MGGRAVVVVVVVVGSLVAMQGMLSIRTRWLVFLSLSWILAGGG